MTPLNDPVTTYDDDSLWDRTMRETLGGTRIPAMPSPSQSALCKDQQHTRKDYVAQRKLVEIKSTVK